MRADLLRLLDLKEQCSINADEMASHADRFARLTDDNSAPRAVSSFNLFQTPPEIADQMCELLDPGPNETILEPSAGLGRLLQALCRYRGDGPTVLVEISRELSAELGDLIYPGCTTICADFLEVDRLGLAIDGVLMNPPFKMGRDVKHIMHALEMLKPGGRLVSLCYDGSRQRSKLQPLATEWVELGPGRFKAEGTNAATCICVIDKD